MDKPNNFEYDLFISHASPERDWVRGELVPALGLPPERIVTADTFLPGAALVNEFERAVKSSRYTVLVLSPAYLANQWTNLSEQLASFQTISEQQARLIPLLKIASELPLRLDFRVRLDCTNAADWEPEIARLRTLLNQPEPTMERLACPYPGMVPFAVEDARFFFGREKEIDGLVRRLRVQNYLFVIGPSGSGKSSLVFAGLIAELQKRQPDAWLVRVMRPGTTPLGTLTATIGDIIDLNTFEPLKLKSKRLLLALDQFEELFTQVAKPDQRLFIGALKSLRGRKECAVVVMMRADFYPDLMSSDLWPIDPSERLEIAPLRGSALGNALNKPAERVGAYLEAGLLERLIADAADEPGALPLVQETMVLLWERMERRLLSLQAYEELGQGSLSGLAVALATRADAVLSQLTESQRALARRMFLRLVQFGEGRADTRRQQSISALRSADDSSQLFEETLRHLTDNRLLTQSGEEKYKDKKVDIAHEALIVGWPAMRQWLTERRVAEQTRRRLEDKTQEWVRLGRETAGLLDEVEIKEASDWLNSPDAADIGYDVNLPQLVHKSRDVLNEAKHERELTHQRQLKQARELAEVQKQRAEEAERLSREIDSHRQISDARRLASQAMFMQAKSFDLALLLSIEACKLDINVETRRSLIDLLMSKPRLKTFLHHPTGISSPLAFSSDGKTLASGIDNTVQLWDVLSRGPLGDPLTGQSGAVRSLAFGPDRKTLAVGSHDGTIHLWNIARRRRLGPLLPAHPHSVKRLAFSPDGRTLASASDAPTVVLWDVASRQPLGDSLTGNRHRLSSASYRPENRVGSIIFSSNGSMLAFGREGRVDLWDVASRQYVGGLTGQRDLIVSLAFSADGKTLASGSDNHSIQLWDIASLQHIRTLTGHGESVVSLEFSLDGLRLASGSYEGSILLWDVTRLERLGEPLTGHVNTVWSLAFTPDGRTLRSGSENGTILLWDILCHQPLGSRVSGDKDPAWSLAISPDGKTLAWGSRDDYRDTILLWDIATRQPAGTLTGEQRRVESLAFSSDGKTLAVADNNDVIHLWDVARRESAGELTGQRMPSSVVFSPDGRTLASASWGLNSIQLWDVASRQPLGDPLTGPAQDTDRRASWLIGMQSVAFSPDGRTLASGHGSGTVTLWDVMRRKPLGAPLTGHASSVASVAFCPAGTILASGSHDDTIRLWDVASCKPLGDPLTWQQGRSERRAPSLEPGVLCVAFSPDGKTLAAGNGDGTIALWDIVSRQFVGDPLRGHSKGVTSVFFSPDGKTLATGSGNGGLGAGEIWIWDLCLDSWKARACRIVNRNLTRTEWAQYVNPDRSTYDTVYVKNMTCPNLPLDFQPS